MNCIALWYSHKPQLGTDKKRLDLELHLNLWKLKRRNTFDHFMDVGLLVKAIDKAANINIFLPAEIKKNQITDLGIYFKNHPHLVAAIFNEDYQVKTLPFSKILEVSKNGEVRLNIYQLDIKNDIKTKHKYGGTIISIKTPADSSIKNIYYRLRITSEYVGSLSHIYKPANAILESAFSNTEVVDFRLNEKRNLHSSLLEEIHKDGEVNFTTIHFFIMREANYDFISSHRALYRSRLLEEDIWNSYIGNDYSIGKAIAYQWMLVEKGGLRSFNAFVKYRFVKSDWKTIAIFLGIILLIAVIGGIAANVLYGIW